MTDTPTHRSLKIAVLCDPASFHTHKWATALQRNGADVTVFSFSKVKIEGIKCVYIPPTCTSQGKLTYLSFMYGGKALRKALAAHQIDVVNPINVTPYGVWAARSGFRPIAMVAMGADILEYPPTYQDAPAATWTDQEKPSLLGQLKNRLKYHFYRYHVQKALHQSAFITGDNLTLVDAVRDWFGISPEKVHLNRWGVEENLFHPDEKRLAELRMKYGISLNQTVILSPRGMKPVYQGEVIFEAFERLVPRYPAVKFVMFSAGYDVSQKLRERAAQLGEKHENFYYEFGLIPREEVIELWSLVDAFISAPLYDGYSNAVAEGRYAGAIPIVNDIPGNREVLEEGKTAFFVTPFTSEGLSKKIEEILPDLGAYQKQFHEISLPWILKHSELNNNIKQFIRCSKST